MLLLRNCNTYYCTFLCSLMLTSYFHQVNSVLNTDSSHFTLVVDNENTDELLNEEKRESGLIIGGKLKAFDGGKNVPNDEEDDDFGDEMIVPNVVDKFDEIDDIENTDENHWDLLIFTQQWPVTTCFEWREKDSERTCSLPQKKELWTIHGIWPTKKGEMGPQFCNRSAEFNLDQLDKIIDRLETYWPTIDALAVESYLWQHEWMKHGTCAMALEELNNELKYFEQGLKWFDNYFITNILSKSGIHPDSNHMVATINDAIIQVLGKFPVIHCMYDKHEDKNYLSEIRICFDKKLTLVDCSGVVGKRYKGNEINTNCNLGKPVYYPLVVPPVPKLKNTKWEFPFVNVYKLIQFIMWFTL